MGRDIHCARTNFLMNLVVETNVHIPHHCQFLYIRIAETEFVLSSGFHCQSSFFYIYIRYFGMGVECGSGKEWRIVFIGIHVIMEGLDIQGE